jgi:hypothetical protein
MISRIQGHERIARIYQGYAAPYGVIPMGRVFLSSLVFGALACSSEIAGITTTRGQWTLQTVNGQPLPFTISGSGSNKQELVADTLMLYEGFTYEETVAIRTTVNGQATVAITRKPGPYAISQGAMIFSFNDGTPSKTATVQGNKMTFGEYNFVRVFTKPR